MRTNAAEVVLHPQRMAILRVLAGETLTTKQLADRLPDIPAATLYRHVALLQAAGIVRVVAERQVRGAVERTYALGDRTVLGPEDLAQASADDHFRYFATFAAGLIDEFGRYVHEGEPDLARDGVGYREHVLNITDAELRDLLAEVRAAIERRAGNAPDAERKPRLLATVTMPIHPRNGGPR